MTVRFIVAIQYDYYDTDAPTLKRILEEDWRRTIQATLKPALLPGLKLDVHAISSVNTSAANPKSRKLRPVLAKAPNPAIRKKRSARK